MTGRPTKRGDVVAVLNGLVREGVITSFKTKLFDQPQAASEIAVTTADAEQAGPALLRVQQALEPLGIDLRVTVNLSGRASVGEDE